MAREHRRLTHELAHLYFVGTIAAGVEPQRFVSLVRTDRTALPPCTLTEAAARRGAESEAAEGAGAGAAPPRAFGWPLELYQVQCDERALSSLVGPAVRQLKSEYAVSYEPSARRARQAARDALALRARLTFTSEAAARAVLNTVGGGCRGRFRVQAPAWAVAAGPGGEGAGGGGGDGLITVRVMLLMVPPTAETEEAAATAASVAVRLSTAASMAGASTSAGAPSAGAGAPPEARPARAGKARAARRRGGGGATEERGWAEAEALWTAEHAELEASLLAMGFGAAAARRGAARAVGRGEAAGGREAALGEAIEWLSSLPPEEADAPLPVQEPPPGPAAEPAAGAAAADAAEAPRQACARARPWAAGGVQPTANPWAALDDE